jgi:hypothetical protein
MKTPLSWLLGIVVVLALSGPARPSFAQPRNPAPAPENHTVSVYFDFDFTPIPPCPQPKNKPCVEQFVVYDISAGLSPAERFKLFTIPAPPDAKGKVRGIKGTSPPLGFQSGMHLIGVTAQTLDKKESGPGDCEFWVTIP